MPSKKRSFVFEQNSSIDHFRTEKSDSTVLVPGKTVFIPPAKLCNNGKQSLMGMRYSQGRSQ
jgi:hypothetical protein